jgi:hypothetical protein
MDDMTVNITSTSLRTALSLSAADRRWIDSLVLSVTDSWDEGSVLSTLLVMQFALTMWKPIRHDPRLWGLWAVKIIFDFNSKNMFFPWCPLSNIISSC